MGEPKHATPALIKDALSGALAGLSNYPLTAGTAALREACAGLGAAALRRDARRRRRRCCRSTARARRCSRSRRRSSIRRAPNATVVCPNPFYQIYEGAALLAGARTAFANSDPKRNFAADWSQHRRRDLGARRSCVYVCSPGNPTGAVMPLDEWQWLFELSDRHGFVIASDECYSEIYFRDEAPLGSLEAAHDARPRRLPQPGRVHEPVQALQRAGHALGLRRRRREAAARLPALPHLPRQRDGPGGASTRASRPGATRRTWSPTATSTARSSRRSRRCWPKCSTSRCPTPASICGPMCPDVHRSTTSRSPAGCWLNTM